MKLYLTNTTILPNDGTYQMNTVDLLVAKEVLNNIQFTEVVSAIGHQSTAEIISELIEREVKMNRVMIEMEVSDVMLAFKLKQRPPEGIILTKDQIEELGYEFKIIERLC